MERFGDWRFGVNDFDRGGDFGFDNVLTGVLDVGWEWLEFFEELG